MGKDEISIYVPPTVGRIVHYYDGQVFAALIVKVCEGKDDRVNLTVYDEDGRSLFYKNVAYSTKYENRCWSWPPKV